MKFLCVPCDTPMKLQAVGPPDRGSLSVVYACPACGYEMAMLTNAYETQIVQSLGVRIGRDVPGVVSSTASVDVAGPDGGGGGALHDVPAAAGGRPAGHESGAAESATGAGCPFAAIIPAVERTPAGEPGPIRWTDAAEARLAKVPAFVRPMARAGIERFARERGALEVDETILDAAREAFGMP
jgi:hypothetical protein